MPLADPATIPADAATATVNGQSVPYIVRVETGVIDRAVYQIAALYDGQAPSPLQPDTSWNGKLVYTFGGGCNSGYHQGTSTGGVLDDQFLSLGYAVASSTLNVLDNNCSTIISAEAAMMVKEHFIDTYGPVQFTIGWGGSGGAIQQYEIADSYPGILDGIIPSISFPDPLTTAGPVTDCRLLDSFFAGASGSSFTTAQKTAIAGYNDYTTCVSWDDTFANRSTATGSCDPTIIPPAEQWSPTNPNGIICNSNEQIVNQLGVDPATGFPNSPLDNVGVQYGLAALDSGAITPAQFATLNASIGGMNFAGVPGSAAHRGEPEGAARCLRRRPGQQRFTRAAHDAGHRPAPRPRFRRLRKRHPHHRLVVHHPRADARRQRNRRQPGHHREPANGGGDQRGQHLRAGRDGRLADEHRERSFAPQRAAQGARRQAGRADRRLLLVGHRPGAPDSHRPRLPGSAVPPTRWRRTRAWWPASH